MKRAELVRHLVTRVSSFAKAVDQDPGGVGIHFKKTLSGSPREAP